MSRLSAERSSQEFFTKPTIPGGSAEVLLKGGSSETVGAAEREIITTTTKSKEVDKKESSEPLQNDDRKTSQRSGSLSPTQSVSDVYLRGALSDKDVVVKTLNPPRFSHIDEVFLAIGLEHRWYRSILIQISFVRSFVYFSLLSFELVKQLKVSVTTQSSPCCQQQDEKMKQLLISYAKSIPQLINNQPETLVLQKVFYIGFLSILLMTSRQRALLILIVSLVVVMIVLLLTQSSDQSVVHGVHTLFIDIIHAFRLIPVLIAVEQLPSPLRRYIVFTTAIAEGFGIFTYVVVMLYSHHILALVVPAAILSVPLWIMVYKYMPDSPVYHLVMNDINSVETSIQNIISFDPNCLNCSPEEASGMVDDVMFNVFESGENTLEMLRKLCNSLPMMKEIVVIGLIDSTANSLYLLRLDSLYDSKTSTIILFFSYFIGGLLAACVSSNRVKALFYMSLIILFVHCIHYILLDPNVFSADFDHISIGIKDHLSYLLCLISYVVRSCVNGLASIYLLERSPKGAVGHVVIVSYIFSTFLLHLISKVMEIYNYPSIQLYLPCALLIFVLFLHKTQFPLVCRFDEHHEKTRRLKEMPATPNVHGKLPLVNIEDDERD